MKLFFLKILTFIICSFYFGNIAFSQNYVLYGSKIFGGNNADQRPKLINLNNNLLIAGSSSSNYLTGNITDTFCNSIASPQNSDIWMTVIDTSFNTIWDKMIGGDRSELNIKTIVNNWNNNYIFVSASNSDSTCEKSENNRSFPNFNLDYWIYCMDSLGNKIFDKTFGSVSGDDYPYLTVLTDSTYLIAGTNYGNPSGDKSVNGIGGSDFWVLKMDSLGNKIWDSVYGGTGNEFAFNGFGASLNILATEDGSFVLAGSTNSDISGNVSQPGQGLQDIWLIKVDSAGNKIWDKRFGGISKDYFSNIIKSGSGYTLLGHTQSPLSGDVSDNSIGLMDIWIVKIDSVGNKIWDKRYGGIGDEGSSTILPTSDGGYWISGWTASPAGFDISDPGFGGQDYWIFKIDSVGNKVWDKRFGGPGLDEVSNFVIMPDSSIFLCGTADTGFSAVKTEFGYGSVDYWIVHFKYGNFPSGIYESNLSKYNGKVYPNPANDFLTFEMDNYFIGESIFLRDITGRFISSTPFQNKITIDIHELRSGPYLYEIKSISGESYFGKFLKFD